MSAHPAPEVLSGYVLGDLPAPEWQDVEAHLSGCPACQAEVRALRQSLFSLVDELPPAPLPQNSWERLQVRRTGLPTTSPLPRRTVRWPLAAAIAALLALGGYATWTQFSHPTLQTSAEQWRQQGAQELPLTTRAGERFGTLLMRPDGQALIVLDQSPPAGKVYQAWGRTSTDDAPTSLGLSASTTLQVAWTTYASVGVSLEPAGGSPQPTHPLGRANLPRL